MVYMLQVIKMNMGNGVVFVFVVFGKMFSNYFFLFSLVMTPNRTIESYRLKPEDVLVFKRRPKDQVHQSECLF
jgi:hypothetical protein